MLYVELSDLTPEDQARMRQIFSYQRQYRSNYLLVHEWIGRKIWRPVHVAPWLGKLVKEPWDDLLIQDSVTQFGHQTKVFRAYQRRDGELIASDADGRGRKCLCFEPIPLDWTYFVIQKVHVMETSVVVRPMAGDRQELLRMF